jgi:hypothetical protein
LESRPQVAEIRLGVINPVLGAFSNVGVCTGPIGLAFALPVLVVVVVFVLTLAL